MSISQNFPAIRPSLLLDFANTERLDPRITFTRTTTATYYDGVTNAKAEENLLLRSQDYSATWTVTNLTPVTGKTAPDGTSTATEFTAGAANAVLTQGYTAIAGSYTFSVFLRRVTGTGDIQIAADNGTWTTKVITGTWARYDVTQTVAAGSKTAGVRVVTSGDAIEVWGAQLEQRSAVTAYTPTTTQAITNYIPVLKTAASGVARFDHNPTTGESLGLLVEEQRTNLVTYSQEFDNAAWTLGADATLTSNTIVAPDGTLTGDKFGENTANAARSLSQSTSSVAPTAVSTTTVYAKAGERSNLLIRAFDNSAAGNYVWANFNLLTGVVNASANVGNATGVSASITPVGNGWYRCAVSGIPNNSGTTTRSTIYVTTSTGNSTNYQGDGYSGIYIWGAQLEAGAFPTSYIPTVAATVTRNADVASMTGTNFSSWYNQAEGTLYTESQLAIQSTTTRTVAGISDGTSNNFIDIRYRTTGISGEVITQNLATQVNLSASVSAITANQSLKDAFAFDFNDAAASANNQSASTDTSCVIPLVNKIDFGTLNATNYLNGTIKKIAYYPIRVTNAQLQALTS